MRILMTTDTIGGVWTLTQELVDGLLAQGDAVALVSLGRLPDEAQQMWVASMTAQWRDRFLFEALDTPLEWMQDNIRALEGAAPALLRVALSFRADLLHANQLCFGSLSAHLPVVVTAHSDVLSWARACRTQPLEETPWLSRYRRLVTDGLSAAHAVVAPTRWMLNALQQSFTLPSRHLVIANGVSISESGLAPRRVQAVTAGRLWDEAKHVALLDEVCSPMPLLLAGETEHEASKQRSLAHHVGRLGRLTQQQMHALFRQSSLYICTSRYEPFGLAPLEAALCGCAVLAKDIPPLREVWQEAALYFTDAVSLSALLSNLYTHPAQLAFLAECSSAQARQFTQERMSTAYSAFFRNVTASSQEFAHDA